jgi:G2/mitotic-specific cyclin 2
VLGEVSTNISATSKDKKKKQPVKKATRSATTSTQAEVQVVVKEVVKEVKKVEQQPVKKTRVVGHDDLDADDIHDPMMVSEYVTEIFDYLKELEVLLIN